MRPDAGLHPDQTRGHIDLAARPLLSQHNCAALIEANEVERVLTDIDADYGNRTLCCRSKNSIFFLVKNEP